MKELYNRSRLNEICIHFFSSVLEEVDIDAGTDLKLLGIGSVVYSELSVYLNRDYNIQSNPSRFFGLSTINDITTYLLMELGYEEKEVEIALRSLESKAAMQGTEEDIAIIAVSFRVPGAATEEDLWNILSEGKSFISETPQNRWTWPSWIDVTTTHKGINKGGYIKEIDAFDASFFRISPREAELMDPQQRILLELSWELFEKSGYKASSLKGTKTGVYIGASGTDYELLLQERLRKETLTGTGTSVALLPNRISYFFDFDGPSMLIDTACSSSLVAIHEAVKSIRSGDCTQAIVGAVHLMCHPMRSVAYYDSNMLSKDGKCHTFDEKANGYVRGEGAVLMFLKPLTDAVKQGNHIAGVIKGTAVNHGGLSGGLTVPNPEKQRKLIEDSYNNAGIDIKSVSYIEAHGTGTILGDPIEITGLTAAFKNLQSSSENPKPKAGRSKKMNAVKAWCGLGSIKSNIGHLEAASGMAGMLKVLLSMKHSSLPPTINYNNLNTKIELQSSPFYIQSELQSWRSPIKDLLRAGVSSFGIGGANGHVVLESFTKEQKACVNEEGKSGPYLFVLSAKNSDRLKAYTEKFAEFIKQNPTTDHAALCYSLQMTREEMEERLAFVYQNTDDLKEILTKYCKGITSESIYLGKSKNRSKKSKVTDTSDATVNSWLTDKDLNNLAKYWCAGLPVDWSILYSNEAPDWVELPTYPFARDRYWIPSEENLKETALNSGNQTNAASSRLYVYNNLWQLRSLSVDSVSTSQSNRLILLAAGSAELADKLQEHLAIEVESLNKEQESSYFMAVFERVKAKILEKKPVEIIVVYRNDEYLDYGFVSGLLKTSALENPKITGKVLGVDKLSLDSLVDIADILEAELNSQDVEVRYLNGRREAKAVSPVSEVPMAPGTGFKEGGVYLITGGAGGLGFIYASHISKIKDSKVILIGRSMLSQEKQTLIKSLTNAVYYRCDICNREEVDSLVATIQQTYGKLDGVIHAAGVLRDSLILKKIKVEIDEVLLPKIQGVKNLDEATKEEKLDFMVFFSSMTAVLGNIGQGDYASANVYLDNYAEYREREREKGNRHGKTISINWPLWEDGGMKVDAESRRYLEQQWGMLALPVTEGVKILEDFLKGVSGQKIVTYGNESDINLKLCGKRSGLSVDISNEVDTEILKEGLIKKLLEFVSLLLKVTTHDLETDEKFGDYGFNSILLTKLSNEINEYYGLELSPAIFYNYPTIKDLAAFLMEDFQAKIIKCHVSISKPADKIEDIYQKTEFLRGGTSISSIHSKEPLLGSDYNEPIAIIGVNGRFPGSPDLNTFWENIKENKDLITEIPSDRWDWRTYYGDPKKDKNKTKAKWGGFIEDIDKFDPLFFNISPREAELIDPQQRIALEAVYHALEDAGINVKELSGSNTGVFIGTYFDDYTSLIQRNHLNREAQSVTGMFQSILTNRISYLFNLHGPSEPIDTACSSSLVAIHRGVEQIRNGSCNLVIAGGVCLDIIPETLFPMTQAGMLSEDGRCRTFDHRANGYVRGEGVGIIILKALSQAEKDGDIIYGVIRGTAVNHGGKANTLTSPNPNAQKSLLVKAYTSANIDPRDVSYIEAHGTGTPIGDPIEIEGLKLAFKELYQKRNLVPSNEPYCALASVKTNIGHLEAAAGIAGVVKVLLSLKHGILPGNPHLEKPNEYLKLSDSPFYLQKESSEWKVPEGKRRIAGISSFGFGGANAHVIIEEYVPQHRPSYQAGGSGIIVLSAKNEDRLRVKARELRNYLEKQSDNSFYSIVYTLQTGRESMEERMAIVAQDREDLIAKLSAYLQGKTDDIYTGNIRKQKLDFLLEGEAGKAYIESAVRHKEIKSLAQLWVKGITIDWNLFYPQQKPARISLPIYPFARERYWITTNAVQVSTGSNYLHPLLHTNESDLNEQKYTSEFTGSEYFLLEHKIQDEKVLPGVAFLELAREAGARSTHRKVTRFKDVSWQLPIKADGTSCKVNIGLYPTGEEVDFEVYTGSGDKVQLHSQGRIGMQPITVPPPHDLIFLQKKFVKSKDQDTCYALFSQLGLSYGPGFRGIEKLYYSDEEVLAKITLPKEEGYVLPPGLLDSALQVWIGMNLSDGNMNLSLPFSISDITIYNELPDTIWSYGKKSIDTKGKGKVNSYDIDILNEAGEVLVRIAGFVLLPVKAHLGSQETFDISRIHLYENHWQEHVQPTIINSAFPVTRLILLADGPADLADKLQDRLEAEVESLMQEQETSYFTIVFKRVKEKIKERGTVDITLVCRNKEYLDYGFVSGLFKTAGLENPKITAKVLGVDRLSLDSLDDLVGMLEAEYGTSDAEVRYLNGRREVRTLSSVSEPVMEAVSGVKEGGIYLITGGAGGLGYIFASHISNIRNTKVILTGRSELNQEKQALIASLNNTIYYSCDVSKIEEVESLINTIRETHGKLDGIIHGAGVLHDSFILKKTKEEIEEVLLPKIQGVKTLDEATRDEKLDFMLLCSSVAGVLGNVGQGDYASANAYLDNYAEYREGERQRGNRYGKTISVNWPLWEDVGMQVDVESKKFMEKQWGMFPMPAKEGVIIFNKIVASNAGNRLVIFGKGNPITYNSTKNKPAASYNSSVTEVVSSQGLYEASVSYFRKFLSEELKLVEEKLETDTPFEAYGIDSLLINRLTNRLSESFVRIPRTLFFEYQNLGELAEYFAEEHADRLKELTGTHLKTPVSKEESIQDYSVTIPYLKKRRFAASFTEEKKETDVVEDIAIIGLSGRYPGARDINQFWENLKQGKDCISEIPADRWNIEEFYNREKGLAGKSYSKWGGFIEDVDKFDPLFFNISPKEAEMMSPQERLFMQTAWETIEDAGYTRADLQAAGKGTLRSDIGGKVGVYVGVMYEEYQLFGIEEKHKGNFVAPSVNLSSIANKVSYFFNLHGPSMAVDTMCSSSLTSIHLACNDLRSGETEMAIAGGVNVSIHPNKYLLLSQGRFVSSEGKCESFGVGGDGYVPAEGVGAVLLKPLKKAIADDDRIYGVIKGTAVNHGGKTNGYTVPNPHAQAAVIKEALTRSGVKAEDINYLEAHGTGTSLGDPIEIAGLSKAFGNGRKQYCPIGSVKSNIGHCESAAGISGLTKVLLQLKHKQLVPSLHSSVLNASIDFADSPFKVQQKLETWTVEGDKPRLAGISSFGAGGSNAHLIVEEYTPLSREEFRSGLPVVIVLSAKNKQRLREQVQNLENYLGNNVSVNLHDLAYTLQVGREAMEERLAIVVKDDQELSLKLTEFLESKESNVWTGNAKKDKQDLVLEGDVLLAYLQEFITKKDIAALAKLWVKGVNVSWMLLYANQKPVKIGLPTYPFARDRYWIPVSDRNVQQAEISIQLERKVTLFSHNWHQLELQNTEELNGTTLLLTAEPDSALVNELQKSLGHVEVVFPGSDHAIDYTDISGLIDLSPLDQRREDDYQWISFLQNLITNSKSPKLKLLIVSRTSDLHGSERFGLYRMLQAEYARINSLHVEIENDNLNNQIIEAYRSITDYTRLRFFNNKWHHPQLEVCTNGQTNRRVAQGPVLITGGTRGIGMTCAKHLVKNHGVKKLVLLGREELPMRSCWEELQNSNTSEGQKIRDILELELHGADVKLLNTPLSDKTLLNASLTSVSKEWGPIKGFLHCAGFADDTAPAFIRKNIESIRALQLPKVTGLNNLHELLKDELDFGVLFSSVSALIPRLGAGQSDYAMANSYMDSFAAYQREQGYNYNSIQWPSWKETGMGEVKGGAYLESGLLSMTNAEALSVLDTILSSEELSPVIFPASYLAGKLDRYSILTAPKKEEPVAVVQVSTVNPSSISDWLKTLVSEELKLPIKELDIDTPFQDYGVDSVILGQLIKRIEKQLKGIDISPTIILENPTIGMLSSYFKEHYAKILSEVLQEKISADKQNSHPEVKLVAENNALTTVHTMLNAPIAVVGMACHFPDAENIAAFWENLKQGKDSIREVPETRWNTGEHYSFLGKQAGKSISKWGAFLENIENFDPEYFGISHALASQIDPLERQWLEVSAEAMADAGYKKEDLWGKRVGVYAGSRVSNFSEKIKDAHKDIIVGTGQNFITAHLAHIYNLKGPNMVVDTACSSSLTAIDLAVKSLRLGETEVALAGGVEILLDEKPFITLSTAEVLSPQGKCRTFDERANGIGVGEGCGVLVLKRLADAIVSGDKIYGVIEGTSINNDGNTMGITTPNPKAQQSLIEDAIANASIDRSTISYIETHGTGTLIGDPIELKAITRVLDANSSSRTRCGVGSVKTNIGHLLSAAGIAGVIKTLLSITARQIPPTLHCEHPNPRFDFANSTVYPVRMLEAWNGVDGVRRAGVSAFGLGGNNAHLILSDAGIPAANKASIPVSPVVIPFLRKRYWPEVKQPDKQDIYVKSNEKEAFKKLFNFNIITE